MRKLLIVISVIVLLLALTVGVSADTAASRLLIQAVVDADGGCQITQILSVRIEDQDQSVLYPLPANAQNIRVTPGRTRTRGGNGVTYVDLSAAAGNMVGEATFSITYTLDNVLQFTESGAPQVNVPLLCGFDYTVETLEFTVTLPGEVTAKPAFSSGYHQASIEQELAATYSGAMVSGNSLKTLKDHETLNMILNVDQEMFARSPLFFTDTYFDDNAMVVFGALALLYWIIFLRCAPFIPKKSPQPPAGYSAGELGSVLTMQGAQINMMVLTWAQLGYVLIQLDRNQRVILHKRMDMGNERSSFEQKCFHNLFGGKLTVDTTGRRYANFCEKMNTPSPNARSLLKKGSGNPKIFRGLCAGIGLFGGFALGLALGAGAWLQWPLAILMAGMGALSAWSMHPWADSLLLLDKTKVWLALIQFAVWGCLGLLGGVPLVGFLVPGAQLLAGLMLSFGGRRTDEGRQTASQLLGFYFYLLTADKADLKRILQQDPDYFHNLAPYALALGMDKLFANKFGKQGISPCPYLTTGMDGHRSAPEWSALMRKTVAAMDNRRKQMPLEKLQKIIASFKS